MDDSENTNRLRMPRLEPSENIVVEPVPTRLNRDAIDLSLFDDIPALPELTPWTIEDILMFMPDGAPGIEGQTCD